MQKEFKKDFEDFKSSFEEYLQLQLDLEKLLLLKKLSRLGFYMFKILIVVFFSVLIAGFLLGALAVWFGNTFDDYFGGVLIAGAGLFVVTVLLILMRKKLAVSKAVANLSRILLNDEKNE